MGTAIDVRTITSPLDYQLVFAQTGPVTIASFMMNTDSAGTAASNAMLCGVKSYTPSPALAWLSVLTPADPLTQNFEIQVSTNDYNLAGSYTVDLVVAFVDATFTATYTQTGIVINLLHPCKVTTISVVNPIVTLNHPFATSGPTLIDFTNFADTVSSAYGNSALCGLTYALSAAADATNYEVTIVPGTPNKI